MIDGYQLKQCHQLKQRSDWYYLMPQSHNYLTKKQNSMTLSCEMIITDDQMRRQSFPKQQPTFQKSHRRAASCTALVSPRHHMSSDHMSQISQPVSPSCSFHTRPSISRYSSLGSLLSKGEGFSGYDASQSNSATSLSTISGAPAVRQCCPVEEGGVERFWLLMQVSEELVKVLFHTRSMLHLSVCLLSAYPCLSVCLSAYPCLSVCLFVCLSLSICLFNLFVMFVCAYISTYIPDVYCICPFICLSVCKCVYACVH